MGSEQGQPERVVKLSRAATDDLAEIHRYTVHFWGERQADRYLDYLYDAIESLADNPGQGRTLEDVPGALVSLVRWPRARHGHRIVYEAPDGELHVLRVVHSARDLATVLDE